MSTNEEILESLIERIRTEGIWTGSPVYNSATEVFGEGEAERLLQEYGCPEGICDGTGWVTDDTMQYDSRHDPIGPSGKKLRCPCSKTP